MANHAWLIFNQLFKILLRGVQTSHLDQNVPHDLFYIPELCEMCTVTVQLSKSENVFLTNHIINNIPKYIVSEIS